MNKVKRLVDLGGDSIYDVETKVLEKLKEKYNCESKWVTINEEGMSFDYPGYRHETVKKYCVMFSGGCDSLSLALRHLEKGDNVALCHIIFNVNETYAAKKTYEILKQIYGNKVLGMFKIFNGLYVANGEDTLGYAQQQITAFYASFIPRELKTNCVAVESAYVMNDDAISYLKELKAIYDNALKFKCLGFKIPYRFPLSKTKHFENIEYIESIERKYNVVFPTGSSEHFGLMTYDINIPDLCTDTLSFIDCYTDSEKENKKNNVKGYIIYPDVLEDVVEAGYLETISKKHKQETDPPLRELKEVA